MAGREVKYFIRGSWILWVTVIAIFCLIGYCISAKASYDTVKIHCDSLVGHGEVRIWIDDTTYLIKIDCPHSTP